VELRQNYQPCPRCLILLDIKMAIYSIDIDNTICRTEADNYLQAKPLKGRIAKVNKLFDKGNHIIIQTARGYVSGIDWSDFTYKQLKAWGVKYHELLPKVYADVIVDDKALSDKQFFT